MYVLNAISLYLVSKSKFILHVFNRAMITLLYENRAEPKYI